MSSVLQPVPDTALAFVAGALAATGLGLAWSSPPLHRARRRWIQARPGPEELPSGACAPSVAAPSVRGATTALDSTVAASDPTGGVRL